MLLIEESLLAAGLAPACKRWDPPPCGGQRLRESGSCLIQLTSDETNAAFNCCEVQMEKVWLGSKSVLLLLEANFLLLGALLSAGRFMGRKRVGYLFLHTEGNELD